MARNAALPLALDQEQVVRVLQERRRGLVRALDELGARLRKFEQQERQEFEQWAEREFGHQQSQLREGYSDLQRLRHLLQDAEHRMEREGLSGRQALEQAEAGQASGRASTLEDELEQQARRKAARREKRQARQESRAAVHAPQPEAVPAGASEVKTLYRALARALHPDSVGDGDPRARELWIEAQKAYELRDASRLRSLLLLLSREEGPAGPEAPATPARARPRGASRALELNREIRSLERALVRLRRELAEATAHPAWGFLEAGGRKRARKRLAGLLELELARLEEARQALEQIRDDLRASRARPRRGSGRRPG